MPAEVAEKLGVKPIAPEKPAPEHDGCYTKEVFEFAGMTDGFCCVGKRRDDDARNSADNS